ncbi:MAG: hypothetical protein RDV48_25995 [Candidatus Eremiobacteraeota bacterium]|nr:hypothetical protein [Candidatus Eremiobacteraeota bacterium]
MIFFCKTGLLVLQDNEGVLHYFDPSNSLKEVAKYVWAKNSLKSYQNESNQPEGRKARVEYIEPPVRPEHRLRSVSRLLDDHYYQEVS